MQNVHSAAYRMQVTIIHINAMLMQLSDHRCTWAICCEGCGVPRWKMQGWFLQARMKALQRSCVSKTNPQENEHERKRDKSHTDAKQHNTPIA